MTNIFFVITAGLLSIPTIILLYDLVVYLYERYSCFHIGRWADEKQWRISLARVCEKWVLRTPVLRIRKPCRYLLLDRLWGMYGKRMVQSWQKAGCLLGLEEAGDGQVYHKKLKKQLLKHDGTWKRKPDKIDYAMLSYALLKGEPDPISMKPAMDEMVSFIRENICTDGMISYSSGPNSNRRYVDTLGFVCPFLGEYGAVYSDTSMVELAFRQIAGFRTVGGISEGLPFHCVRNDSRLPLGILGWGRGCGWYALAVADLFPFVTDPAQIALMQSWMKELANTLLQYERKDGGFSSMLLTNAVYDSSATAMIGYFFSKTALYLGNEDYRKIADRCRKKLMKKTKLNGVVDECQGDTIDIGIMSERYGEMPFAQGIALRLAASLDKRE